MFCRHCATQLPDDAAFCTTCGKAVASAPQESSPAPVSQPEDSHVPPSTQGVENLAAPISLASSADEDAEETDDKQLAADLGVAVLGAVVGAEIEAKHFRFVSKKFAKKHPKLARASFLIAILIFLIFAWSAFAINNPGAIIEPVDIPTEIQRLIFHGGKHVTDENDIPLVAGSMAFSLLEDATSEQEASAPTLIPAERAPDPSTTESTPEARTIDMVKTATAPYNVYTDEVITYEQLLHFLCGTSGTWAYEEFGGSTRYVTYSGTLSDGSYDTLRIEFAVGEVYLAPSWVGLYAPGGAHAYTEYQDDEDIYWYFRLLLGSFEESYFPEEVARFLNDEQAGDPWY